MRRFAWRSSRSSGAISTGPCSCWLHCVQCSNESIGDSPNRFRRVKDWLIRVARSRAYARSSKCRVRRRGSRLWRQNGDGSKWCCEDSKQRSAIRSTIRMCCGERSPSVHLFVPKEPPRCLNSASAISRSTMRFTARVRAYYSLGEAAATCDRNRAFSMARSSANSRFCPTISGGSVRPAFRPVPTPEEVCR